MKSAGNQLLLAFAAFSDVFLDFCDGGFGMFLKLGEKSEDGVVVPPDLLCEKC